MVQQRSATPFSFLSAVVADAQTPIAILQTPGDGPAGPIMPEQSTIPTQPALAQKQIDASPFNHPVHASGTPENIEAPRRTPSTSPPVKSTINPQRRTDPKDISPDIHKNDGPAIASEAAGRTVAPSSSSPQKDAAQSRDVQIKTAQPLSGESPTAISHELTQQQANASAPDISAVSKHASVKKTSRNATPSSSHLSLETPKSETQRTHSQRTRISDQAIPAVPENVPETHSAEPSRAKKPSFRAPLADANISRPRSAERPRKKSRKETQQKQNVYIGKVDVSVINTDATSPKREPKPKTAQPSVATRASSLHYLRRY